MCNLHKQLTSLGLQSEALISLTANIFLIEDIAATASPLNTPSEELLNLSNNLLGMKQLNVLLLPKEMKIGMLKDVFTANTVQFSLWKKRTLLGQAQQRI